MLIALKSNNGPEDVVVNTETVSSMRRHDEQTVVFNFSGQTVFAKVSFSNLINALASGQGKFFVDLRGNRK